MVVWGAQAGTLEAMDEFEKTLIRNGFVRVPDNTPTEDMRVNEFRRQVDDHCSTRGKPWITSSLWRAEK